MPEGTKGFGNGDIEVTAEGVEDRQGHLTEMVVVGQPGVEGGWMIVDGLRCGVAVHDQFGEVVGKAGRSAVLGSGRIPLSIQKSITWQQLRRCQFKRQSQPQERRDTYMPDLAFV